MAFPEQPIQPPEYTGSNNNFSSDNSDAAAQKDAQHRVTYTDAFASPTVGRPDLDTAIDSTWKTIGRPDFNWMKDLSSSGQQLYRLLLRELGDEESLSLLAHEIELDLESALNELNQQGLIYVDEFNIVRLK